MNIIKHNGQVLLSFKDEGEIRLLKMFLDAVDKTAFEKTVGELPPEDLSSLYSFVFGMKSLFIDHLPECKDIDPYLVLKEVESVALDSWGNRGLMTPA